MPKDVPNDSQNTPAPEAASRHAMQPERDVIRLPSDSLFSDPEYSGPVAASFGRRAQRSRHVSELTLLAMALPLIVFPDGKAAWAATDAGKPGVLEGMMIVGTTGAANAASDAAMGPGPFGPGAGISLVRASRDAGISDEHLTSDAFLAGFARDLDQPVTLDHVWSGDNAAFFHDGVGEVSTSNADAPGAKMTMNIGFAVGGGLEPAMTIGDWVTLLEERFWDLVAEIAAEDAFVRTTLESTLLLNDEPEPGEGLTVDTGGAAFAIGDYTVAFGEVSGDLLQHENLTIATGYTHFEAMSASIDQALAQADASAFAAFSGADFVLTMRTEFDSTDTTGNSYLAISRVDYYALDYADWSPAGGPVHIDISTYSYDPRKALSQPANVATVNADTMALAPNSVASNTTHATVFENQFSSVSALAQFGGAA